mgnify:CR=1 FL=1|jgi:hypothetical protein
MQRRIIEVLKEHPDDQEVIVPVYEQYLSLSDPRDVTLAGLWEGLYVYACEDAGTLVRVLQDDPAACNLLATFDESWFVRAELAQGSTCESRVRDLGEALAMARALRNKSQCEDVLAEVARAFKPAPGEPDA